MSACELGRCGGAKRAPRPRCCVNHQLSPTKIQRKSFSEDKLLFYHFHLRATVAYGGLCFYCYGDACCPATMAQAYAVAFGAGGALLIQHGSRATSESTTAVEHAVLQIIDVPFNNQ